MSGVEGTVCQQNPAYEVTSLVSCEHNVAYELGKSSGPHLQTKEPASHDQVLTHSLPASSHVSILS